VDVETKVSLRIRWPLDVPDDALRPAFDARFRRGLARHGARSWLLSYDAESVDSWEPSADAAAGFTPARRALELPEGAERSRAASDFMATSRRLEQPPRQHGLEAQLEWACRVLDASEELLAAAREAGASIELVCFWSSSAGHGGPTLPPHVIASLARAGAAVWLDCYLGESS